MPTDWSGTGDAYAGSFAALCAGTIPALLDAVEVRIGAPGRLLDVGAGVGTLAAAAVLRGHDVVGVEPEASMRAVLRARHPGVRVLDGGLPHLPVPARRADAAVANFVINHVDDPHASVGELSRVVRAGGAVAVTIWPSETAVLNRLWSDVLVDAGIEPLAGVRLPAERDFPRTAAGLAGLLVDAALERVEVGEVHWTFSVGPDALWRSVTGGIGTIGATWRALDAGARGALTASYARCSAALTVDGEVRLPSTALLSLGTRSSQAVPGGVA